MKRNALLPILILTFIESFATILIERGAYFFTEHRMAFTDVNNLLLGLGFGICYFAGAMSSHRMAVRFGERSVVTAAMVMHILLHLAFVVAVLYTPAFIAVFLLLAVATGMKWPIFESYVSAGRDARSTARAVGIFSIAWSTAVPPAMAAAGWLIALDLPNMGLSNGKVLFIAAAAVNVITMLIIRTLPAAPVHMAHDHPDRLPAPALTRYKALMRSSRWAMFTSYALLFLLAPLMPTIFKDRLGFDVTTSLILASLVEIARVVVFVALFFTHRWHGNVPMLIATALCMPIGFLMVLFGADTATVLIGEVLFGLVAGGAYYAAIYYAMVVANASVDAGGDHEGFIGLGFALGPLMGLMGIALTHTGLSYTSGMLVGVLPITALCVATALYPLRHAGKSSHQDTKAPSDPLG
jgi:MFS family permease